MEVDVKKLLLLLLCSFPLQTHFPKPDIIRQTLLEYTFLDRACNDTLEPEDVDYLAARFPDKKAELSQAFLDITVSGRLTQELLDAFMRNAAHVWPMHLCSAAYYND